MMVLLHRRVPIRIPTGIFDMICRPSVTLIDSHSHREHSHVLFYFTSFAYSSIIIIIMIIIRNTNTLRVRVRYADPFQCIHNFDLYITIYNTQISIRFMVFPRLLVIYFIIIIIFYYIDKIELNQ